MTHSSSLRHRKRGALTAIVAAMALTLTGCFAGPPGLPTQTEGPEVTPRKTEVTVHPLYVRGSSGGSSDVRISVAQSDDGQMKVDVSETEVSGAGDMLRGALWNAVTVATLLTGGTLDSHYKFQIEGRTDGPSGGALYTSGVLSLLLGDDMLEGVTMTGTIMPTGGVGFVGGIPEKVQGAIDTGDFTKILIPQGQRNDWNHAGDLVDVVQLGATGGVEVVEVANIYEAYRHLTGAELPAPEQAPEPRYSETMRTKLKAATSTQLAGFRGASNDFFALNVGVQDWGYDLYLQAKDYADDAARLESQGLQAGAFTAALNANLVMTATTATFQGVEQTLREGIPALNQRFSAARSNVQAVNAYIDTLGTFSPVTLTDAEALIAAYGNTFDAFSLGQYAIDVLDALIDDANAGGYPLIEDLAAASIWPLMLFELAGGIADAADALFQLGRDNGGEAISDSVDLGVVGSFFRRSADANWNAFMVTVIQPRAEAWGFSNDRVLSAYADADLTVALSYSANSFIQGIQRYIGEDSPNAAYAAMGYGFLNYARNAILLEKYGSNTQLDNDNNIVGVHNETLLTRALELAKTQLSRSVALLEMNGSSPALSVASFEDANVRRERDVAERFTALESYSSGFVSTRMLAYIAGNASEGWTR